MIKNQLEVDKKTLVVPIVFQPFFHIMALIFDLLPSKFQIFNSLQYRELTKKIIYSDKKCSALFETKPGISLESGLKKLINHYKDKGLI